MKRRLKTGSPLLLLLALCAGLSSGEKRGLLIMAHGGDAEWDRSVEEAAAPLRDRYPVAIALGMAQRRPLQRAVDELEARGVTRIAVVRLQVSRESFLHQTEYLFGLRPDPPSPYLLHQDRSPGRLSHDDFRMLHADQAPPRLNLKTAVALSARGLADSEEMGRIAVERVMDLSTQPARESVLLLAHGEEDDAVNRRWQESLEKLARQVAAAGPFRAVEVATLREDWKEKRKLAEERIRAFVEKAAQEHGRALVVPFRVHGFGPYGDVLEGLEYVSDGRGLLPHPGVTEWLRRQAEDCFERLDAP